MNKESILKYIEQLDERTKKDFWKLFNPMKYKKREFFIKEGEHIKTIGYIRTGVTRSFIINQKDEEVCLGFGIEKDFVAGGFAVNEPCTSYIEVIKDAEILVADYLKVFDIINSQIRLRKFTVALTNYYIKRKQDRLSKINFTSASERYSYFLQDYPGLINRIPHYYIANYLGITPTQLSRLRKSFVEEN